MKLFLFLSLLVGAASAANPSLKEKLAGRKLLSTQGPVICHLYQVDGTPDLEENDEDLVGNYTEVESFVCETSASEEGDLIGRVYEIDLPPSFIEDKKELIEGGRAMLTVTNAVKTRSYDSNPDTITLADDSVLSIQTERRGLRRLAGEHHTGPKTFLLMRITTQDTEYPNTLPVSALDISNVVWGLDGRDLTMQNQFGQCSADKLQFEPAEGLGVIGGVLEITLDVAANKATPGSFTNIIYEAAADILGADPQTLFDFAGVCYPDAFNFNGNCGYGTFQCCFFRSRCHFGKILHSPCVLYTFQGPSADGGLCTARRHVQALRS